MPSLVMFRLSATSGKEYTHGYEVHDLLTSAMLKFRENRNEW